MLHKYVTSKKAAAIMTARSAGCPPMVCDAPQSLARKVGLRLLQGMFGAALVPLSQATLLDTNRRSARLRHADPGIG
jgi:hypothetical protein